MENPIKMDDLGVPPSILWRDQFDIPIALEITMELPTLIPIANKIPMNSQLPAISMR